MKMPSKWLDTVRSGVRPCFLITFFYFFVIVIYRNFTTNPQFNYYNKARSYTSKWFDKEPKAILLWNGFFESRNWYLPGNYLNESYFAKSNCPVTNCFITINREVRDITEYDAVLFHTAEAFPILQPVPPKRSPNQLYVFATMESPAHTKHDLSDEIGFYNLTMTYRTDSDIFWPYGIMRDLNSGQILGANIQPIWRQPTDTFELDAKTEAILAGKNKTAAWFVSHCDVLSKRDELAKALQKYIPIDIYGSCGPLKKVSTHPEFNYYETARSYTSKPFSKDPKAILLWNGFFGSQNWNLPGDYLNESYFAKSNCPVTNCFITINREVRDITEYDAVLFHTAEAFPILQPFPPKRSPNQLYVFATMESPGHTKHDLSDEIDFYNVTMTYRTDSDIFWPYGIMRDLNSGQILGANIQPIWRMPLDTFELDAKTEAILAGKNKMAAWFVSHCNVLSKRDDLVKALQKYMPIDIYGSCGPLKCPRGSNLCNEKLDFKYKFYLSFENSLCKDYITEKLFHILDRNIIPVVYGGADYSKFLPPLSYINVEDFKTVKDLANYLKFLDENPKEYRKYFWWKKYYKKIDMTPFCELCAILNDPSRREKVQFYKDIQEWWFGHMCRMKPKIKF